MLISELLSLNEAAETVTYDINGVKLTAKVVANRRPTKHESGTWDVVLLNKKSGVKITAPEFFSYTSGWSQGTGRSVQGWYLDAHGYGGAGNGSGRSTQSKPSLSWRFERDAIEKMVGRLGRGDKDELRYVDVEDDNNVLELFEKNKVTEGRAESRLNSSISILPAARAIFDKNKVGIADIVDQWKGDGVLYVIKNGDKKAFLFSGGGDMGSDFAEGKTFKAKHDQTWKDLGDFTVDQVIKNIKASDFSEKLGLYVFK